MSNKEYGTNIEVKVGIFVGVSLVLFFVTLFSLREGSFLFSHKYTLKVKMDSIEGLGQGSLVQLLGLSIGNVGSAIPLPAENKVLLNLDIDKSYQNMITKGSVVETYTQGVLGDKFVSIEPYFNSLEVNNREILQDGDFLAYKPKSDMFSVISSQGNKIEDLFIILKELSILIKNLNKDNKPLEIMSNLNETSRELKGLVASLNLWTKNIQEQEKLTKSLDHLTSVLEKIDNGQGTLGTLINDSSLYDRIDTLLSGSQRQAYVKELVRKTIKTGKD